MIEIDFGLVLQKIDTESRKRVTLSDVSRRTGISIVTLSRIKTGRVKRVRRSTVERILAAYPFLSLEEFQSS